MRCTTPARRFPGWIPLLTLALAGCQPAAGFPDGAPGDAEETAAAEEAAGGDSAVQVADAAGQEEVPPAADSGATSPAATPAADTAAASQQGALPPVAAGEVTASGAGSEPAGRAGTPQSQPPSAQPPASSTGDCRATEPPDRPGTRRLSVYFTCGGRERPVVRVASGSPAVLRAVLEALLRGPTGEERAAGYQSFFSDATAGMLRGVAVRDGVARVDFRDFSSVIPNASSSAGSEQLLAQLRSTIFQFPTVQSAEIVFDGSCDRFWNWLQRGCQRLTR